MIKNQKGSFTVEASIILPVILLIIVIFFKSIISQYLFYFLRGALRLDTSTPTQVETGLYFDTRIKQKKINTLNTSDLLIECQSEELNYLTWAHSYLMAEEVIGAINEDLSSNKSNTTKSKSTKP